MNIIWIRYRFSTKYQYADIVYTDYWSIFGNIIDIGIDAALKVFVVIDFTCFYV